MPLNLDRLYREGEAADLAMVAELAADNAELQATSVASGVGWIVTATGRKIDYRELLDEPGRRRGTSHVTEPGSFVELVNRLAVAEATTLWANRDQGTVTAVLNDHPPSGLTEFAEQAPSGFRDSRAVLSLEHDSDWRVWMRNNGQMQVQALFGEMIEDLAHTIIEPDSATFLEIATTLTGKKTIDFSSRTRLDNGDVSFALDENTEARSGRGERIEIPQEFRFRCSPWEGTEPVDFIARLRFKLSGQGVLMGYKIMRMEETVRVAWDQVVSDIGGGLTDTDTPIYNGTP